RSRQHVRRNRQADLLGGFEVDDELELRRLLHREISRLGAFQNLVHIRGSASEQVGGVRAIVHESAGFRIAWLWVNRREPVLCRQVRKLCSLENEDRAWKHEDCVSTALARGSKCSLNILGT